MESRCIINHLHFSDIALSEDNALVHKGREVAHDVVNGDASGESNTSLEVLAFLGSESLLDLFFDHGIDSLADSSNISSWDGKLNSLCEAN